MKPFHFGQICSDGKDFKLPVQIATKTTAILGLRGAGKTNTAAVLVEELLDRNLPLVIIDPTDAWWGIRSEYPVFIFGGEHGDVPLQESDGKTVAGFIVDERVPVVLSLRHLRKGAQRRFVREFCEEIYHLKGKDANRTALAVIIDEAPLFVPQKVIGEMSFVVSAVEDLIARGRSSGFGVVLISQRSATINKDVLTQSDVIIAHRLTSPQDKKALGEWFEDNASSVKHKEILSSLAGLDDGQAWVWAPTLKVMELVQIRRRHTFDSGATPELGQAVVAPKNLKEIDLTVLKTKMAATLERARADDPKVLKAEITRLVRELNTEREKTLLKPEPKTVEVPVLTPDDAKMIGEINSIGADCVKELQAMQKALEPMLGHVNDLKSRVTERLNRPLYVQTVGRGTRVMKLDRSINTFPFSVMTRRVPVGPVDPNAPHIRKPKLTPVVDAIREMEGQVTDKAQRRILTVLAQHPEGCEKGKLALLACYAYSGGFRNSLSALRTAGFIEGDNGSVMKITETGLVALGAYDELPTGEALQQHWLSSPLFGSAEREILKELLDLGLRDGISGPDIAEAVGKAYSGGFRNSLSKLRTAGLIVGRNTDRITVSEHLL